MGERGKESEEEAMDLAWNGLLFIGSASLLCCNGCGKSVNDGLDDEVEAAKVRFFMTGTPEANAMRV